MVLADACPSCKQQGLEWREDILVCSLCGWRGSNEKLWLMGQLEMLTYRITDCRERIDSLERRMNGG